MKRISGGVLCWQGSEEFKGKRRLAAHDSMALATKKLLGIVASVGGLVYLAQNYTIHGLQHLRIEPLERRATQGQPAGWPASEQSGWARPSLQANLSQPLSASGSTDPLPSILPKSIFPTRLEPPTPAPILNAPFNTLPISTQHTSLTAAPIRIASFNLHFFGQQKAENPFVIETLTKILRQYNIVAIQEICTKHQDLLPLLIERINQSDRKFDYVIGPRVGRSENKEQFAFIFDTATIETDRQQLYSVDDPEDLLAREPLVGWFRCKSVPAESAFTFTLVNVHLDTEKTDAEVRVLPELVRSVQRDGRKEDDILLIGDFGVSDGRLQFLRSAGMIFAIEGIPTTTQGNAMLDNIAMPAKLTDEFNGRSGVFDFLRHYNFSIEQAHQVSDHLPVWAEYTPIEGGLPGAVQ